ncbi:MAG TPA: TraB/GumN family protein [Puia sp.]|nr:TraB/GumN family protein [Puia sp.]
MKKGVLIFLASWPGLFSMAQPSGNADSSRPVYLNDIAASDNTLLWRISGKGLERPCYLFGTMHILCADQAKLSDQLLTVIHNCDEVFFEINLDDMVGIMKSLQFMQMRDGKKLSDLLSTGDYTKVKSYFENHSSPLLPFSLLERFKPLLISSIIEEDGLDCKTTNGMELMIMKEAHAQHKKIDGLETASFQAGLFDSIPYENQAKDLVNYIDSMNYYRKMTNELAGCYIRQDLHRIDELTRSGDATVGNYLDLLLYGRNRTWARSLDTLMPGKCLLIAVGAGHLPGDQGVISLLKKNGYQLTPMKN